jgi:hypothetical protein
VTRRCRRRNHLHGVRIGEGVVDWRAIINCGLHRSGHLGFRAGVLFVVFCLRISFALGDRAIEIVRLSDMADQCGKCARLALSTELDRVFVVGKFLRGLDQVVCIRFERTLQVGGKRVRWWRLPGRAPTLRNHRDCYHRR